MKKIISNCPSCGGNLKIVSLKCEECGLELNGIFDLSDFENLNKEQFDFLITFLKCKGNMKVLQNKLKISYPAAKKRFSQLLTALNIVDFENEKNIIEGNNMNSYEINENSTIPSEIIKTKLIKNGGHAIVESISGMNYEIIAANDGVSFYCDELPVKPPFTYQVFDVIVDLLIKQGGKALKGMGRNSKLGEKNCEVTTVVGAIGQNYFNKNDGESVLDPVFVLAAVLEWADIAHNRRGYLELSDDYKNKINI